MFYWLAQYFDFAGFLNLFRYLTFRSGAAVGTAFLIGLIIGPRFINMLRVRQGKGQPIRSDGPQTHLAKVGTPTMGGLMILTSIAISMLLWMDLSNSYVWACIVVMLGFGFVGFMDDYDKVKKRSTAGVSGKLRLLLEFLIAGFAVALIVYQSGGKLYFPFINGPVVDLGYWYIIFGAFVIVAFGNAVNLTDGLDGLAIGATLFAAATYAIFTYVAGNRVVAQYLQVAYVPGVGEVTVFCGALVGASAGFLWWNAYPAEVFMGDVGSLALGGAIGTVAVLAKQELLLVVVGGLFVIEALSVILQVASFKLRGKRIFRMAPIHHHFELGGWAEPKIIVRFWIVAALFALVALSTLKLR